MTPLTYCFFPTKVVCIDDDEDTLKTINLNLNKNTASYEFFDSPLEGLAYLNKGEKPIILFDRLLQSKIYPFDAQSISHLYEEIYNPQRYDAISCVIIDQVMPAMKGLDLCRQIENSSIKKILLTGIAEEELAIDAFNKGIIDFYIRKHDPKAYDLIDKFIERSQVNYFKSLTETHIHPILKEWQSYDPEVTALFDPAYIEFFHAFIKEHKITEYYLLDLTGSFLFLNASGKFSALYVYNDQMLTENHYEVENIIEASSTLSKKVIEDLKHHRKTVCFPFTYERDHNNYDSNKYIYPLQILNGQRRYHIAYVSEIGYLMQEKVLTFSQYKKSASPIS